MKTAFFRLMALFAGSSLALSAVAAQASGKSPERNLTEAETGLIDAKRQVLEYRIIRLRVELYKELALSRPLRSVLGGTQGYKEGEKRFLWEMQEEKPLTPEEWEARDKQFKRPSASFNEAVKRCYDADLRRAKLVAMLIRDLGSSEVEELRTQKLPIDSDPDVKKIVDRHGKP